MIKQMNDQLSKKVKQEVNEYRKAMQFQLIKKHKRARACTMILDHGPVNLPVYMPVGTKGTIKGLTSQQMEDLDCQILLGNTYHLNYQPGMEVLRESKGLHGFMNWKRNILTDSGGFQMVSLSKLCQINEEGVEFTNPYDNSEMKLRPEDSIGVQNTINADIIMALDDVVKTTTDMKRMKEAKERTVRWIERCFQAHSNKTTQNLFPICQGGVDDELRQECVQEMVAAIDQYANGYAVGGLAGGESKEDFARTVELSTRLLPENKPRYLMGVGYPEDLVVGVSLGIDMFDCVYPTRTARFGNAFTKYGQVKLRHSSYMNDFSKIDDDCDQECCSNYTKSYYNRVRDSSEVTCHLVSIHNLHFLFRLMRNLRKHIIDGTYDEYVREFFKNYYRGSEIPEWVKQGMKSADIPLEQKQ